MPKYELNDLLLLMRHLRDPVSGCPWDKRQTFASVIPHTLEEAYEVADAIESNDMDALKLELGDLLFQVVFYAQIGKESGQFSFQDIVSSLVEKLLRRHPHVFPDGTLSSYGQKGVLTNEMEIRQSWEKIKQAEREIKDGKSSLFADVPKTLPALIRAEKIQKRAAQAGFDWDNLEDVLDKLTEEIVELRSAVEQTDQAAIAEEMGDVLFSCVNVARHLRVDTETELRNANKKFQQRFQYIEQTLAKQNQNMQDTSKTDLEILWQQAKESELQ